MLTESELFKSLIRDLKECTNDIYNSSLKDTKIMDFQNNKLNLIKLLDYQIFVYEYIPSYCVINNNNEEDHQRSYLFMFLKRDYAEQYANSLSKNGLIVCYHDHLNNTSYYYKNGLKKKWDTKSLSFLISYTTKYDEYGYPSITTGDYIYDYGSDIYEWSEILNENNEKHMGDTLINDFVQITVIDELFKSDKNLLTICLNLMKKIN